MCNLIKLINAVKPIRMVKKLSPITSFPQLRKQNLRLPSVIIFHLENSFFSENIGTILRTHRNNNMNGITP